MSRIGNRPIKIEEGISVEVTPAKVVASFGNKKKEISYPHNVTVKVENGNVLVGRKDDSKDARSQHGLTSRLIASILTGVKDGFKRELEFKGTGYRAAVNGNEVVLNMGYSHEIKINIPEDLQVSVVKNSIIVVGDDKQRVGSLAAQIREVRGPEVYKGKGIRYKEEFIKRKAGKKASS